MTLSVESKASNVVLRGRPGTLVASINAAEDAVVVSVSNPSEGNAGYFPLKELQQWAEAVNEAFNQADGNAAIHASMGVCPCDCQQHRPRGERN